MRGLIEGFRRRNESQTRKAVMLVFAVFAVFLVLALIASPLAMEDGARCGQLLAEKEKRACIENLREERERAANKLYEKKLCTPKGNPCML